MAFHWGSLSILAFTVTKTRAQHRSSSFWMRMMAFFFRLKSLGNWFPGVRWRGSFPLPRRAWCTCVMDNWNESSISNCSLLVREGHPPLNPLLAIRRRIIPTPGNYWCDDWNWGWSRVGIDRAGTGSWLIRDVWRVATRLGKLEPREDCPQNYPFVVIGGEKTFADPHGSNASIHKGLKIKLEGPHGCLRIDLLTTLLKELGLKSPMALKGIHNVIA